jgi:hypothetical protein
VHISSVYSKYYNNLQNSQINGQSKTPQAGQAFNKIASALKFENLSEAQTTNATPQQLPSNSSSTAGSQTQGAAPAGMSNSKTGSSPVATNASTPGQALQSGNLSVAPTSNSNVSMNQLLQMWTSSMETSANNSIDLFV